MNDQDKAFTTKGLSGIEFICILGCLIYLCMLAISCAVVLNVLGGPFMLVWFGCGIIAPLICVVMIEAIIKDLNDQKR